MVSSVNQIKLWGARQNGHAIRSALLYLLVLFVTGVAIVGGSLLTLQLSGAMPQPRTYTLQTLLGATVFFGAIIAASIISAQIWARWLDHAGLEFIGLNRDHGKFFAGALWGIGLHALIFLAFVALNWLRVDKVVFDRTAIINTLIITISSVNAGVMEEVVYRGTLYSALRSRWSKWTAAVILSVCFSVSHFIGNSYGFPIGAALGLFAGGLLFTWAREITGGLWLSIGVHFAWDAAIGWFNLMASKSPHLIMTTYTIPTWMTGLFGANDWIMLVAFAVSLWVYSYRMNVRNTMKLWMK